jgi:hypothetical protein
MVAAQSSETLVSHHMESQHRGPQSEISTAVKKKPNIESN